MLIDTVCTVYELRESDTVENEGAMSHTPR
jgi:hypothetical protein